MLDLGGKVNEHQLRADLAGRVLDLRKAVHRRGVEAGDQPEIEQQKSAIGVLGEQRLDMPVESMRGAEEQMALQAHALQLAAMPGEQRQLARNCGRARSGIPSRRSRT